MKYYTIAIIFASLFLCLQGCNTTKAVDQVVTQNKDDMSKVIIEIQPDYSAEEIAASYSKYELQKQSKVSRHLNAFLFTYNSKKITEKALLELFKADKNIILARGFEQNPSDKTPQVGVKKIGKRSIRSAK